MKNKRITKVLRFALLTTLTASVMPISAATTAHAAERTVFRDGCWVTPLTPKVRPGTSSPKLIDYPVRVKCQPQRIIFFEQVVYEDDPNINQVIAARKRSQIFTQTSGDITVTITYARALPDTDAGQEAMFHEVKFRTGHLSNGFLGYMTGWIQSPNLYVSN